MGNKDREKWSERESCGKASPPFLGALETHEPSSPSLSSQPLPSAAASRSADTGPDMESSDAAEPTDPALIGARYGVFGSLIFRRVPRSLSCSAITASSKTTWRTAPPPPLSESSTPVNACDGAKSACGAPPVEDIMIGYAVARVATFKAIHADPTEGGGGVRRALKVQLRSWLHCQCKLAGGFVASRQSL